MMTYPIRSDPNETINGWGTFYRVFRTDFPLCRDMGSLTSHIVIFSLVNRSKMMRDKKTKDCHVPVLIPSGTELDVGFKS